MKRSLEDKQAEKSRLYRSYRAWKREQLADHALREPRLAQLATTIRRAPSAGRLVMSIADSWIRNADPDVRALALSMVARRCAKAGGRDLDDPLPPATSAFFLVRDLLQADGRLR